MLAAFAALSGEIPWGLGLMLATAAVVIILGHRIFRPAVTREPGAVVCHYIPWYETGAFVALVAVPLIGLSGIALASEHGSSLYGWGGLFLLAVTPLSLVNFLRARRRCLLRITPTVLGVPMPDQGYAVTDVPRAAVQSITSGAAVVGLGTKLPLVELRYAPGDPGRGSAGTVRLGPAPSRDTVWLTVEPADLLTALEVWNESDPKDPALLDHIEAILCGSPGSGFPPVLR